MSGSEQATSLGISIFGNNEVGFFAGRGEDKEKMDVYLCNLHRILPFLVTSTRIVVPNTVPARRLIEALKQCENPEFGSFDTILGCHAVTIARDADGTWQPIPPTNGVRPIPVCLFQYVQPATCHMYVNAAPSAVQADWLKQFRSTTPPAQLELLPPPPHAFLAKTYGMVQEFCKPPQASLALVPARVVEPLRGGLPLSVSLQQDPLDDVKPADLEVDPDLAAHHRNRLKAAVHAAEPARRACRHTKTQEGGNCLREGDCDNSYICHLLRNDTLWRKDEVPAEWPGRRLPYAFELVVKPSASKKKKEEPKSGPPAVKAVCFAPLPPLGNPQAKLGTPTATKFVANGTRYIPAKTGNARVYLEVTIPEGVEKALPNNTKSDHAEQVLTIHVWKNGTHERFPLSDNEQRKAYFSQPGATSVENRTFYRAWFEEMFASGQWAQYQRFMDTIQPADVSHRALRELIR